MSTVTVKQAAKLAGKSRQSINQATRDGILAFKKDGRGRKVIEIVELERVYPLVRTMEELEASTDVKPDNDETSSDGVGREELAVLRERVLRLEAERDQVGVERERERRQLEDQIDRLQSSLEKSQEQQSRAMLLLTDQSEKSESRGGFLSILLRMFRRRKFEAIRCGGVHTLTMSSRGFWRFRGSGGCCI